MNTAVGDASGHRLRVERRSRGQRGYSLFELVCVILVVSVLGLVLLDRALRYQAMAEKTAMELTIMNMRSGLRLRVAELMMADRTNELGGLVQDNPIRWLEKPPANYLGEIHNPQRARLPVDTWHFDPDRRELVYLLRRNRFFGDEPAEETAVVLKVTAVQRAPAIEGSSAQKTEGLALVRVTQAR
ncbi:MAG: prepilin-type N-terminal cleavage/methylation domain-containing protein [Arenimonas sp.]|jgi:general secretion pathway protein G